MRNLFKTRRKQQGEKSSNFWIRTERYDGIRFAEIAESLLDRPAKIEIYQHLVKGCICAKFKKNATII